MEELIPAEQETIAAKRASRLSNKIKEARLRVFSRNSKLHNSIAEFVALVLLFGINLYLIQPFIGSAHINVPFSGPGIPTIARILAFLYQVPFPVAVQFTYTYLFLVFPIAFYFLVKLLTGRRMTALISVLIASLPFSFFAKTRIGAGFLGDDGPHIASLGILPLALFGVMLFLRHGGLRNLAIAAALNSAIILTSPFGFLTYAILASIYVFSEMLQGMGRLKFLRFLILFLVSAALSSFWYNPAFLAWLIMGSYGADLRSTVATLLPLSLFAVPILGIFGFLLFDRKPNLQPLFLATFWTIAFSIIVFVRQGWLFPSIPPRYLPELGLSLAFLLGIGVQYLIDYLNTVKIDSLPNTFNQKLTIFFPLILVSFLSFLIMAGRENNLSGDQEVIKFEESVAIGRIWLERNNFDGIAETVGYGVTVITAFALVAIHFRFKKSTANI